MTYEDAIQEWGKQKLKAALSYRYQDKGRITVKFDFDPGFTDNDPESYGSFDEPPRSEVVIKQGRQQMSIHIDDFDFQTVLGEIVVAGGGTVTA